MSRLLACRWVRRTLGSEFGVASCELTSGAMDGGVNKERLMGAEKLRRERKLGFLGLFFLLRIE